jgi:hypothetical protein
MDNNQANPSGGQLPSVRAQTPGVAQNTLPSSGGEVSVAQQAQQILADGSKSPSQMTQQFVELKSRYLQNQGVQIGE